MPRRGTHMIFARGFLLGEKQLNCGVFESETEMAVAA
jgi:hypothetical protein